MSENNFKDDGHESWSHRVILNLTCYTISLKIGNWLSQSADMDIFNANICVFLGEKHKRFLITLNQGFYIEFRLDFRKF